MELITNIYSLKDKFIKEEYLLEVLEEINEANNLSEKFNSRSNISLDKKSNILDEEILKKYNNIQNTELKKLIVGIDYSGYVSSRENKYDDIIPIFIKLREKGLGISISLGKNVNYQFLPLAKFIPERVVHGFFLKDEYIEQLIKRNIRIKICPTYSFKINKCIDYSEINMENFGKKIKKESGEEIIFDKICINSDCRTLIFTDISQEYYEIGLSFNLGINDFKNLISKTIDSLFDKDEELHNKLKNNLNNFYC